MRAVWYDDDGKAHQKSFTASTYEEAEALKYWWSQEKQAKTPEKEALLNITVYTAVSRYVESRTNVLSPATSREYKKIIQNYVVDTDLGATKIKDVSSDSLQRWVSGIEKSAKTVSNAFQLVHSALRYFLPDRTYAVHLPRRPRPEPAGSPSSG